MGSPEAQLCLQPLDSSSKEAQYMSRIPSRQSLSRWIHHLDERVGSSSLEASSEEACFVSNASRQSLTGGYSAWVSVSEPTANASRWTHHLGKRARGGTFMPIGGHQHLRAATVVQSLHSGVNEHRITALWDTRSWSEKGAVVAEQFSEPARADQGTSYCSRQ